MTLVDQNHQLAAIQAEVQGQTKEQAFLLEGTYADGAFFLEGYVDAQEYVPSSGGDYLILEPKLLLAALRTAQKRKTLFVFLHTHPHQSNLHFSRLDRCFERDVVRLAKREGFQEPLLFLLSSCDETIGRAYRDGWEEALWITEDEWSIPRGWLGRIQVLTEASQSYGVLYDPRSNGLVRLAAPAARLIEEKQREQGRLPAAERDALEAKLRDAFCDDQHSFLKQTPTYLDTGELNQLEILLQNGCNLRCRYCFAQGGTYGQKSVRLTPEKGGRIIRILVEQGIHKISKITFFGGEPSTLPDTIEAICETCTRCFESGQLKTVPEYFMVTNCVSISTKCLEVICRYRIHLTISIDGPAEINDQLRVFPNGHETHDRVLQNLQRLREVGVEPAMVEATYTAVHERAGLTREQTITALQKELGISGIYLCDCDSTGRDLEPQHEEAAAIMERDNRNLKCLFEERNYQETPLELMQFVVNTSQKLNQRESPDYLCDAGLQSLTIGANGDVYPCHLFIPTRDMLLDNVFLSDFDIQIHRQSLDEQRMYTKLGRAACRNCWARNFCSMCLFRICQAGGNAKARAKLKDRCAITRNRLEKTIVYLSNMQQEERRRLYEAIGELQPVRSKGAQEDA